jgi:3-oxoacyl-[acyl-carrier-protein] synthase-3
MYRSIITGSGSFIPEKIVSNSDFLSNEFYTEDGVSSPDTNARIIEKFGKITGIRERRYADDNTSTSQMAAAAAEAAIADSGTDRENIHQLIVAHNFGEPGAGASYPDLVPSLASRVKKLLGINNPSCIPYDLIFGCPGWLQGVIQADAFFKGGLAKSALIIGAEILSRVVDSYDRDSMIFSDGAGAVMLEFRDVQDRDTGLLSVSARADCGEETDFITLGETQHPGKNAGHRYLKMKGRKVYEYALRYVPAAMKECLDKSGHSITDLKAIFIHQANEKMDEEIVKRFYTLYGIADVPANVMPMCIQWLGNSSVATIPTLYDLVRKALLPGFSLHKGDLILFASVGAGMNINAVSYRCDEDIVAR